MKVEKEAEINKLKSDLRIVRDSVAKILLILDENELYSTDIQSARLLLSHACGFFSESIHDIETINS